MSCALAACGDDSSPVVAKAPQPTQSSVAPPTPTPDVVVPPSITEPGHKLLAKTKAAGKFFVAMFTDSTASVTPEQVAALNEAGRKAGTQGTFVHIDLSKPGQSHIKKALDLGRTPMPVVVAVAPTGAITKTLVGKWDAKAISEAFVGPGVQATLGALQCGKLAVVLVQASDAADRNEARAGWMALFDEDNEEHADDRAILVAIHVDPSKEVDRDLCAQLRINPSIKTSTTVVLAPPHKELGRIEGATTVKRLLEITRRYKAP